MAYGQLMMSPDVFWEMIPAEFFRACRGYADKLAVDNQRAAMNSWYTEAFARTKRLPQLDKFILEFDPNSEEKKNKKRDKLLEIQNKYGKR